MPFELCYQGSVNRWECDENDHLNVRFYLHKAHQALDAFARSQGISTCLQHHERWLDRLKVHHIRYLREARMAVPLSGYCALLGVEDDRIQILTELRHSQTGTAMATFVSDFEAPPGVAGLSLEPTIETLPGRAGARGVPAEHSPYAALSAKQALAHGYRQIGAGIVQPEEVDERGRLCPWHYMGRTSDAMPNLWSEINADDISSSQEAGVLGGAVLEYRMSFARPLYRGEGYRHLAAIGELGRKTQQISHLIYDRRSDALVVSAEALGISLDLETRKSVEIPAARRARLQTLQRAPLNAAADAQEEP